MCPLSGKKYQAYRITKFFSKPNGVVPEVYFLNKSTFNVFCASGKQDTLFGEPFPNSIVHDPLQFGEKRKQFPNR